MDSERGIAWRVADSLSLRRFLGYGIDEKTPDHSTISRTRRLFWLSTHKAVFAWVLKILANEGLVRGETIAIDGTTLEANAAMRAIVRRETGQKYDDYLRQLAKEAGLEEPTREQLARFDRKRKKKGSNEDWKHPHDPDARITKMKDGRTHLAHKAEHAVDLSSGAMLAVTLQPADEGDTTTIFKTLDAAQAMAAEAGLEIQELVGDKGYHSNEVLVGLLVTACAATSPSLSVAPVDGKTRSSSRSWCMGTGGVFVEPAAGGCRRNEPNWASALSRISTRPEACADCI